MSYCAKCFHSFNGKRCPLCGGHPVSTWGQMNDATKRYVYLNIAGLAAALLLTYRYPLLDTDTVLLTCLVVFFLPLLLQIVLAVRKQVATHFESLRAAYKWAGIASAAIAMLLLLNGALDRHSCSQVRSSIIRKTASHGRGGTSYYLTFSPSWRHGHNHEKLRVNRATFDSVRDGEPVAIDIHSGALGLPWFGKVTPP
jgi:hypothetical protein